MKNHNHSILHTISVLALVFLIFALLCRPETAFQAAEQGLSLWWQVVLPALLPFFITSELLVQLGAAKQLGQRLSPLMRPLFALPGPASLAVVMGFCAGFPTGAMVTASLYKEHLLEKREAERLLAFSNNAGPLYITAAVATGLLHCAQAAWILALSHYGLNLLLGILLGFFAPKRVLPRFSAATETGLVLEPLGKILKTAAQRAAANILLIGCFMVFFSVITAVLVPSTLSETRPLLYAALSGVLEMSLGINALAESSLPLRVILPWVAAQLAFGGFCVQAQVLAMIADSDLSPRLYLLSRPLHGIAAALFTAALFSSQSLPVLTEITLPQVSLLPLYLAQAAAAFLLWLLCCKLIPPHPKNNI